jgi:hypothetical protein
MVAGFCWASPLIPRPLTRSGSTSSDARLPTTYYPDDDAGHYCSYQFDLTAPKVVGHEQVADKYYVEYPAGSSLVRSTDI